MPISQNSQTHSNNSLANCLSVFGHFVGLALKGLIYFYQEEKMNPYKLKSVDFSSIGKWGGQLKTTKREIRNFMILEL